MTASRYMHTTSATNTRAILLCGFSWPKWLPTWLNWGSRASSKNGRWVLNTVFRRPFCVPWISDPWRRANLLWQAQHMNVFQKIINMNEKQIAAYKICSKKVSIRGLEITELWLLWRVFWTSEKSDGQAAWASYHLCAQLKSQSFAIYGSSN